LFLLAVFGISLVGCGGPSKSYKMVDVAGTVELDGKPIEKGVINFIAENGDASAEIVAGKFEARDVPLGKVRIYIKANRETGKMTPGSSEPVPEIENIIPEKYNQGIEADIAGDETDRKIELSSQD
jgi:hypothetical protein